MCPQQNNTPDEQRRLEELRRHMRENRPGAAPAWRALWIWPVVIVLILLLWVGVWGWGSSGGWWGRYPRNGAVQSNTPQGNLPAKAENSPTQYGETSTGANRNGESGSAMLNAKNKQQFVGQPFEMVSTPVLKKINDTVFWIGTNNAQPMLVVLATAAENTANAAIHPGEDVNIVGVVEKPPDLAQMMRQWDLDRGAAERVEHEGAYVRASEATPQQSKVTPQPR